MEMFRCHSRDTIAKLHENLGELDLFMALGGPRLAHASSGPVVRIGPNLFSISDLDVAREVYGARTLFEKVGQYHFKLKSRLTFLMHSLTFICPSPTPAEKH